LIKLTLAILFLFVFITDSYTQGIDLQYIIDKAKDNDTIFLGEGVYEAVPSSFTDELCGNCLEHKTNVFGTKGFFIKDKSLHIAGVNREKVILKTNAGYGFLFFNSINSSISGVTIGSGVRDTSGDATNASIVLKFSRVTIENCILSNDTLRNIKIPIVGISGVVIRESSEAIIRNNLIRNNTWDGIALYRGASALITDNIIENGRGAGIGVTWDATAIILRNRVSGFWKGIGSFGTSNVTVRNNIVFDNLGWGIVITGNSHMLAENNVVTRNGNCGIAPWCDSSEFATGIITNNIITENGWRKEWVCPQVGYWLNGDSTRFIFEYNNVWNNFAGDYKEIENQTGINGNISKDPMFISKFDFGLRSGSPMLNAGNPLITNSDGSRSHIGSEGGQSAFR
jgi:parallel beta-helix repeat protein